MIDFEHVYKTYETHNDEIVKEELFSADEFSVYLKLPRLGTYLVEAAPL